MTREFKHCPLCGSGNISYCVPDEPYDVEHLIYCGSCSIQLEGSIHDKQEITDIWNKRQDWQPINTAPHNEKVLLFYPTIGINNGARIEIDYASNECYISSISAYVLATHWLPLPDMPIRQL